MGDTVVAMVTMKPITMDTITMDMDTDTGTMMSISTRRRDTSMVTTDTKITMGVGMEITMGMGMDIMTRDTLSTKKITTMDTEIIMEKDMKTTIMNTERTGVTKTAMDTRRQKDTNTGTS